MKQFLFLSALVLFLSCSSKNSTNEEITFNFDELFSFAETQYLKATQTLTDQNRMPRNSNPDGTWRTTTKREWTSGFFPGVLWQLYRYSGDEYWKKEALSWTLPLTELKHFDGHHDLGFMIFCSFGEAYKYTKDPEHLDIIIQSAKTLATRFRPEVGTILSWGNIHEEKPLIHQTIIDNMMNLELLLWAARHSNNEYLYDIAITHANTTMESHFRNNNSTYHVVDFDPNSLTTGDIINQRTHQGYADWSMWARGQAWAIYGFTMMYRKTSIEKYLNQAKAAADIFISRLPDDVVPYWDFDDPNIPGALKDASAGAIAASAFIELYQFTDDLKYYNSAIKLLNKLSSDEYLAINNDYQCVLLHSVGNKNRGSEVDVHIIYADYYFLEALNRLNELNRN